MAATPESSCFCNSLLSGSELPGRPEAGSLTSPVCENACHLLVFEFDNWPSRAEEYLTARQVKEEKASFTIQLRKNMFSFYLMETGLWRKLQVLFNLVIDKMCHKVI